MEPIRIMNIKKSLLENNDEDANLLRTQLAEEKTFLINLMSSPGSGKTTTLVKTIQALHLNLRIGVMEADIDSAVDAETIAMSGVKVVQLHTGGMCHLDADMTRQGLQALGIGDLNLVFLENVGNLVCPAEFDSGANKNVAILSVPEGDDKPLKYPLMFQVCDVVLINKIDAMSAFDFNIETATKYIHTRNPNTIVIPISARTGEGMDKWCNWILDNINV